MLDRLIGGQIFALMVIFLRMGTAFLVLPTVGEFLVPVRIRLLFALVIAVLVLPVVHTHLPSQPATVGDLLTLTIIESLIGLFLGLLPRLMMGALEVGGMVIAQQSGLSNAYVFNPALATQGSLPGAFLSWLGLSLILVTNLHHVLLRGVVESYETFPVGKLPYVGDMSAMVLKIVADGYRIGVEMASPFLATGLVFSLALGLMARLAPQIQVLQVYSSLQPLYGLFVFSGVMAAAVLYWLRQFDDLIFTLFLH